MTAPSSCLIELATASLDSKARSSLRRAGGASRGRAGPGAGAGGARHEGHGRPDDVVDVGPDLLRRVRELVEGLAGLVRVRRHLRAVARSRGRAAPRRRAGRRLVLDRDDDVDEDVVARLRLAGDVELLDPEAHAAGDDLERPADDGRAGRDDAVELAAALDEAVLAPAGPAARRADATGAASRGARAADASRGKGAPPGAGRGRRGGSSLDIDAGRELRDALEAYKRRRGQFVSHFPSTLRYTTTTLGAAIARHLSTRRARSGRRRARSGRRAGAGGGVRGAGAGVHDNARAARACGESSPPGFPAPAPQQVVQCATARERRGREEHRAPGPAPGPRRTRRGTPSCRS